MPTLYIVECLHLLMLKSQFVFFVHLLFLSCVLWRVFLSYPSDEFYWITCVLLFLRVQRHLIQGFWDPVGFTADGEVSAFKRRRSVELKHGRISMMATMGSSAVCQCNMM